MKLSIITINYNNAEGLRKTLASVASQTYADIEHVIVDGGSTDGSVEIIEAYASDVARRASGCVPAGGEGSCAAVEGQDATPANGAQPLATQDTTSPKATPPHKVTWISEKDKGIYNAMNKGIEIALGRRVVNAFNRSELVEDKNKGIEVALGKRVVNDDHTSSPNSLSGVPDKLREFVGCSLALSPNRLSEYIQILNSGDILAADDVTERMVAALEENVKQQHQQQNTNNHSVMEQHTITANENNALSPIENRPAIFYGNMIKEYPDGRRVKDTCGGGDYTPESFLYFYRGTLNHDCAYIRRNLFEKYGLYNEELKICSDWEWYVRAIVLGGEKTVYTNIDVTVFDMMGISESNGKNKDIILKERREYLESILPAAVLRDYDMFSLPIEQYRRLKKYHLWGVVHFVERVLFNFEKWFKRK